MAAELIARPKVGEARHELHRQPARPGTGSIRRRCMNAVIRKACALLALLVFALQAQAAGSERLSLDQGWLFHRGEVVIPPLKGHGASYHNGKTNGAPGAAAADYDDSSWRRL